MSDWKIGAAKRRDVRATQTPDTIVNVKGKTKKTKRWCKGKVGVEHKPVCMLYKSVMTHDEVNILKDWRQICGLPALVDGGWLLRNRNLHG